MHDQQAPPQNGTAKTQKTQLKRCVETLGFFDVLYKITEAHTIQLIASRADKEGHLRLTILCNERPARAADDENATAGKKKGRTDAPAKPAPISNRVLVGTPEEFDAPDGVVSFFRSGVEQARTLAEAKARADRAHALAVEAEKKRETKAKARKENADPGGPLFSEAGEDPPTGEADADKNDDEEPGA